MYIIRFDDVAPTMNWSNFNSIKNILNSYNILSVIGVVPLNKDNMLDKQMPISNCEFIRRLCEFKEYGDTIAQHGTYHLYSTKDSGLLDINNSSEFAGHSYDEQLDKLAIGKKILESYGVWQPYFMAPSHSFDLNTLKALKQLGFKAITDGYGFYPYQIEGLTLVPQLVGKPIPLIPFGVQTICLHTNSMSQSALDELIKFIHKNNHQFLDFKEFACRPHSTSAFKNVTYFLSKFFLQSLRSLKRQ